MDQSIRHMATRKSGPTTDPDIAEALRQVVAVGAVWTGSDRVLKAVA